MLIRTITYENLDGEVVSEDYYFNLSKPELIDLEVEYKEGFKTMIETIIAANDRKELINQFKKLVLMTYGIRSEDGKRFIKNDQLREEFSQTPAYDALFMELATDDGAAVEFLTGILPRDLRGELSKAMTTTPPAETASPKPPLPPTSPQPPSA